MSVKTIATCRSRDVGRTHPRATNAIANVIGSQTPCSSAMMIVIELPLTSRWPASAVMICWSTYVERLSRALGVRYSTTAHNATIVHCPAADQSDDRRRSGRTAMVTGAASGKNPTGPFESTAPAMQSPEAQPVTMAAAAGARLPIAMAATAAVTNTQTVVSSRFPTIDQETTGASIHKAIGNQ